MSKDVTKLAKFFASLALAGALADCSGSISQTTPPVTAASASQAAAPVEHTDAARAGLGNCISNFACEYAVPVESLAVFTTTPKLYLEKETPAKPYMVSSARLMQLGSDSLLVPAPCGTCHIIASATPLALGSRVWAADVEGPLKQSGQLVTATPGVLMLEPGNYYFYIANV
jgi:hypothetical protein